MINKKQNFFLNKNITLIINIATIVIILLFTTSCKNNKNITKEVKKSNINFTEIAINFIKLNEGYTNYIYTMNGKETVCYGFQDKEKLQPIKDIINNNIVDNNIAIKYICNKVLKETIIEFMQFIYSRKELSGLNYYQKIAVLSYMYKRYYSKNPINFLKSQLYKDILNNNVTEKSFAIGEANRTKREFLMYIHI